MPGPTHALLRQGIDKAFNLEQESAISSLRRAAELDPENPTVYAFLALAHMFFHELSFDLPERDAFQAAAVRYISEACDRGEKRIGANPKDGEAYFAMALAKITRVRLAIRQKDYVNVALETSSAWSCLEKANRYDPDNHDVYFLMGVIHYHIDHLPILTRSFSALLITPGDSRKGLEELELAAAKGDLLKELAQAELVSAYLNFEKQPSQSLPIARALKKRYPRNYNFLFAMGNSLADLRRFREAHAMARQIDRGIRSGRPPYSPLLKPRYEQLMGRILFNQGRYDEAAEHLQMALKDDHSHNARVRAWAYVRLGMIHDVRKERGQAEECYLKALEVKGGEGAAQVDARLYLKTPYSPPS
jgi:tetratricopeptide (TPR) repeat protein